VDDRRLHDRLSRLRGRAGVFDRRAGDTRLSVRIRSRSTIARRRRRHGGAPGDDPHRHHPDAQPLAASGAVVKSTPVRRRPGRRLRWLLTEVGSVVFAVALLVWSLLPVYNMLLIALDPDEGDIEFEGLIWPSEPSLHSFQTVVRQGYWLVEHFWHQLGNSFFIGLSTMFLAVLIGSLASFAFGRMRAGNGWLLVNVPLITYAVPASFLVIPFMRLMASYGLSNSLWAIVAANVAFATPYAILILRQYATLIPIELDEAARVDGGSPLQVYRRIYLPLMAPALAAVGTFALLLAWNEYLYQYVLLSSPRNMNAWRAGAPSFS